MRMRIRVPLVRVRVGDVQPQLPLRVVRERDGLADGRPLAADVVVDPALEGLESHERRGIGDLHRSLRQGAGSRGRSSAS